MVFAGIDLVGIQSCVWSVTVGCIKKVVASRES